MELDDEAGNRREIRSLCRKGDEDRKVRRAFSGGPQVTDGRDVRTRKRRRRGGRNGGPRRPSTSPRSRKGVGHDGRMRDAHHRAEGGSTGKGQGEA
jgi:hypothetical protein